MTYASFPRIIPLFRLTAPRFLDHAFHRVAEDEEGTGEAAGRLRGRRRQPQPEVPAHEGRLHPRRREGVSLLETRGLESEPRGQKVTPQLSHSVGPIPTLSAIPHQTRWRSGHGADFKSRHRPVAASLLLSELFSQVHCLQCDGIRIVT